MHFAEVFVKNLDILNANNIILFFFLRRGCIKTDLFLVLHSYKVHVFSFKILRNPYIAGVLEMTSKPLINIPEC